MMTSRTDPELIRLLHGELGPDEACALRQRIGSDPGLAAAWQRLERTWSALEPPPAAPPPPGFSGRVMAAALLAGAAAGIGVGVVAGGADPDASADAAASSLGSPEFNLAESYWGGVEDATARSGETGNEVRR
jgi:ferric-dicitrate binding protein FerR (iron transport regulator)